MIAAIYARKSTDDSDRNAEARSTTRQVERATAYAHAKGWTVDPRYVYVDEHTSGAEWKHRHGWNTLLAALEPSPPFGVVVVSELSRIGRRTARTLGAIEHVEDAGVEIHGYLSGARISLVDEAAEMTTVFGSVVASHERRRASERAGDAGLTRFNAGAVTGGSVYGYRNVRDGKGFVYHQIDEAEASVVRRIFDLYASGNGLTRIAKRLNADHVSPPTPRHAAPAAGWSVSALREMIRRPLYAGVVIWNRTERTMRRGTSGMRRRPEAEWLHREAPGLRIIGDEQWRRVQSRRERAAAAITFTQNGHRRGRPPGTDIVSPYLLSGIAVCAECSGSLVAFSHTRGPAGDRQRVRFYGCIRHARRGTMICKNDVMIRQEKLDAAFLDALAEAIDERLIARAVEQALARLRRCGAAPDPRPALAREQAELEVAMRHLLAAVKRGQATDTLLGELAAQEARAKAITSQLADLDGRPRVAPIESTLLAARLGALGRELRGALAAGGPAARPLLQRVLGGRRVACEAFREPGRRGYRFRAEGIPYAGILTSPDMRITTRLHMSVDLGAFDLAGVAVA